MKVDRAKVVLKQRVNMPDGGEGGRIEIDIEDSHIQENYIYGYMDGKAIAIPHSSIIYVLEQKPEGGE